MKSFPCLQEMIENVQRNNSVVTKYCFVIKLYLLAQLVTWLVIVYHAPDCWKFYTAVEFVLKSITMHSGV